MTSLTLEAFPQTEEACKKIVEKNGLELQFVENQTEEICMIAIQQNSSAFKYVKNQTYSLCRAIIEMGFIVGKHWENITLIKEQTEDLCQMMVKLDSSSIMYIRNPSYSTCVLALENNGDLIRLINEPTLEMRKIAVTQMPTSLQFIQNQTEDICKIAVEQYGLALSYVQNQTEAIIRIAIENTFLAGMYVADTPEMDRLICSIDGRTILYVKEPTIELCRLAVLNTRESYSIIKSKCDPFVHTWTISTHCTFGPVLNKILGTFLLCQALLERTQKCVVMDSEVLCEMFGCLVFRSAELYCYGKKYKYKRSIQV